MKKKEDKVEEVVKNDEDTVKKENKKKVAKKTADKEEKVKENDNIKKEEAKKDTKQGQKETKEDIKDEKKEKEEKTKNVVESKEQAPNKEKEKKVENKSENNSVKNAEQEKVMNIIKKAKENGKITYGELANELDDTSPEQLDKIFDTFEDLGVDIKDSDDLDIEPDIDDLEEVENIKVEDVDLTNMDGVSIDDPVRMYRHFRRWFKRRWMGI